MHRDHFKRTLAVWACASIAALTGSAALADLPRHLHVQTLEPTQQEVLPPGAEEEQSLFFGQAAGLHRQANVFDLSRFMQ